MNIRATKGNVFVLPIEEKYEGIIQKIDYVPTREMPKFGKVIAIGGKPITKKGVVLEHEFKVGDEVFFRKFTGTWVEVEGQKYIQIKAHDIEAVLCPPS